MRQKRAKAYRKLMALYCMSFGFRQPYQVLVDSEMCKTAIAQKLDFVKQLGIVLQGTVKPMITQCCIHELYLQGKAQQPAVDLAKIFERRKCNHREAIPGDECLTSVIGDTNKHRYVVATQSQPLRSKLRSIPGVPILHINRSVMILEPPSDMTLRAKELADLQALNPSTSESARLKAAAPDVEPPPKKKHKGPKGPNPLSVKKKKTPPPPLKTEKAKENARVDATKPSVPAKAGQKRKREDDGHEADAGEANEGSDKAHAGTVDEGHKKRRRRRRKPNSSEAASADVLPT